MARIVIRANNPVDWKTGEPLQGSYRLESHHIFPKNRLYEEYDSSKSSHRKLVNEIANRAFLTPKTNRQIGDALPSDYLPDIVAQHPAALESQFIPNNPELWKIENYESFLAKRRDLLATAINDYMDDLSIGDSSDSKESVEELIAKGENARIEFKETFLYDVYRDQPNKELKSEVAKEIAALANSEGGVLLIGIEDGTKEVKGLERDYSLMRKGKDSFERQLLQEISNRLNQMMASAYTHVEFEETDGKEVCVIWVDDSPEPVFFDEGDNERFYVRTGTSAEPMSIQEANGYIEQHWV